MNGAQLIAAKRQRQIEHHGWTAEHDAHHSRGELVQAALSYVNEAGVILATGAASSPIPPEDWPWQFEWWRPDDDPIENLVNAGALLAAEIDRLLAQRAGRAVIDDGGD